MGISAQTILDQAAQHAPLKLQTRPTWGRAGSELTPKCNNKPIHQLKPAKQPRFEVSQTTSEVQDQTPAISIPTQTRPLLKNPPDSTQVRATVFNHHLCFDRHKTTLPVNHNSSHLLPRPDHHNQRKARRTIRSAGPARVQTDQPTRNLNGPLGSSRVQKESEATKRKIKETRPRTMNPPALCETETLLNLNAAMLRQAARLVIG